jgi:hypothetical protein
MTSAEVTFNPHANPILGLKFLSVLETVIKHLNHNQFKGGYLSNDRG